MPKVLSRAECADIGEYWNSDDAEVEYAHKDIPALLDTVEELRRLLGEIGSALHDCQHPETLAAMEASIAKALE